MNVLAKAPATRRSRYRWYILGFLAAVLVVLALYTKFLLWWSYSEGERAGALQKLSRRGWVCKTYEGELAMYVVRGMAPQIWNFTVRDAAVAARLNEVLGQNVRLHYTEHPGLPTDCFGETDYFVDRVEPVGTPPIRAPLQP